MKKLALFIFVLLLACVIVESSRKHGRKPLTKREPPSPTKPKPEPKPTENPDDIEISKLSEHDKKHKEHIDRASHYRRKSKRAKTKEEKQKHIDKANEHFKNADGHLKKRNKHMRKVFGNFFKCLMEINNNNKMIIFVFTDTFIIEVS